MHAHAERVNHNMHTMARQGSNVVLSSEYEATFYVCV